VSYYTGKCHTIQVSVFIPVTYSWSQW